jgi:preprotein translocase subunit SecE
MPPEEEPKKTEVEDKTPETDESAKDEGASRAITVAGPAQGMSTADESVVSESEDDEEDEEDEEEDEGDVPGTPAVLGAQRFVFAAYFTGAVAVAFLLSKAISYGWMRLSLWKPAIGEPDEMVAVSSAAVIGGLVAFYYYRDKKVRTLAEEVASELGKVTWPSRDEVVNGTFVVLVTTALATAFFALMDRFWGFVTNLVYGV